MSIVLNEVFHDTRVMESARAISDLNYQVTVLGAKGEESIEIKHGCSEYYEKYPKYKNFRDQNMSYDKNWLKFEKSIDDEILSRSKEDEKYIGITINKINLSDVLIIINWLKYAKNIGDKTYLKILEN